MKKKIFLSAALAFSTIFSGFSYYPNILDNFFEDLFINKIFCAFIAKSKDNYNFKESQLCLTYKPDLSKSDTPYRKKFSSLGYDNMKTNAQTTCYKEMESKIDKITSKINSDGSYEIEPIFIKGHKLSSEEVRKVVCAFQNDHPEIFWLARKYYVVCRGSDTILKMSSVISKEEYEDCLRKLNNKVNEIIMSVPRGLSEYDRELFIHDYMVKKCKYEKFGSFQTSWRKYTCLGCLIDGKAVCEGYSKAIQVLLMALGVQCRTITGSASREQHMWNMVKIENDWYHLDVTWDSTDPINRYSYFNVTDKIIMYDHKINDEISKMGQEYLDSKNYNFILPECSSLKYNYFNLNSLFVTNETSDNDFISYIVKNAKSQKNMLYLKISEKLDYENFVRKLFHTPDYRFFKYMDKANRYLDLHQRFSARSVRYFENKVQRVIGIEVSKDKISGVS